MMRTSAQVVEASVTTIDNSLSQDYTHPDDQTTPSPFITKIRQVKGLRYRFENLFLPVGFKIRDNDELALQSVDRRL